MRACAAVLLAGALAAGPGAFAVNHASPVYNAETTYAKLQGEYPFIRIASRIPPATVQAVTNLTYARHGAHALQLDLYLPAATSTDASAVTPALSEPAPRLRPGIIFVHGGGWRSGVRENFTPMAIRMAGHGYVAATISYRLSPEAPYPAAIHDVKAAIRWMRAHAREYGIDENRIVIAGGSAGGQIASLVGMTNGQDRFEPQAGSSQLPGSISSAVQAVINIDGLSDFTSLQARLHEDDPSKNPSSAGAWFGGNYAEKTALWHEASPTFHVNAQSPPILFITSSKTRYSIGREAMSEKLQAFGIAARTVQVPDTPHSFWLFDPWLAPTVAATVDFLEALWRVMSTATAK